MQRAGTKFDRHESFRRHVILTTDPEAPCGRKAESGVVTRVPENHDRTGAELSTALKACTDQSGPDACALTGRRDRHRRKTHEEAVMTRQCHGCEHNVADEHLALL